MKEHVFDNGIAYAPDARPGAVRWLVGGAAHGLVELTLVMKRHACFHCRAGQPVKHSGLMLEHHEGHNVAVRRKIETGRESIAQVDHVYSARVVDHVGPIWPRADHVAHVLLAATLAGHVPATPAL